MGLVLLMSFPFFAGGCLIALLIAIWFAYKRYRNRKRIEELVNGKPSR